MQARYKIRELCARLIRDARADIGSGRTKLATKQGRGPRGLPAGAFVHHLLQADSTLLGRPFTDDEARLCLKRSCTQSSGLPCALPDALQFDSCCVGTKVDGETVFVWDVDVMSDILGHSVVGTTFAVQIGHFPHVVVGYF